MVSLCKIKINAFLSLRAIKKYLALVEMLSPVLLGHKKKGRCLDSDHKLHFSIISLDKNTTSTKSVEVLSPLSSEKE